MTERTSATLVLTLVLSKLDYCNSLLVGANKYHVQHLQRLQNTCARLVKRSPRWAHVSPVLESLHWLPIKSRIDHKCICNVYKCLSGTAPQYLCELLNLYTPLRDLRSSGRLLLSVPSKHPKSYGQRAFSHAGPKLWNAAPEELRR